MADGRATADPAAVLAALGLPAPEAAQALSGGADTAMWQVRIEGAPYVLRVLRPGEEDRAAREAAAAAAATSAGLPAPALRVRGAWEGRPALLLDWCHGAPLFEAIGRRPADARRLGRLFGALQVRMHAVPAPAGLPPHGWLRAGGPAAEPLRQHLLGIGLRDGALLHLDYHPGNVLCDGTRLTGIVDWANAGAGDPRADLARTLTILELDIRRPGLFPPLVAAALLRFTLGWREGCAAGGAPLEDRALAPFYAWAAFAMAEDLASRREPAFLRRVRAFAARQAARAGVRLP